MKKLLLSISSLAIAALAFAQKPAELAGNLKTATGKGFEFKLNGKVTNNCLPDSVGKKVISDTVATTNSTWGDLFGGTKKGIKNTWIQSEGDTMNAVVIKYDGTQGTNKSNVYTAFSALYTLRFPKLDCGYGSTFVNLSDSASRNVEITVDASDSTKFSVFPFFAEDEAGVISGYADQASLRATFNLRKGKNVLYGFMTGSSWNGYAMHDFKLAAGLAFQIENQGQIVDLKIMNIKVGDAAPMKAPIGSLSTIQQGDKIIASLSNDEITKLALSVAPNPASDKATISYASQAGKLVTVVLSNGVSTVATIAGGESSTEINVAGLAAGLYYASVYVDGAYASTAKVLVK